MVVAEQKNKELNIKLPTEEREKMSGKASLKNAHNQAEEQRKKLHYAEIELAMAKQEVMDLKAELERAKEAAWFATATANASEQKFYDLKVQETEARLIKELAEVCKEYCQEVWIEALNLAEVPATSE